MTAEITNDEYQCLTRSHKMKKVLPKVLPLLLLSVILPTADVGTDLALIANLYIGVNTTCIHEGTNDYEQCQTQGADNYCSDPASNQNVCSGSHPKVASSLLFFFLLNYVMGLVTCIRLEGRKWVPLITALFIFYPQYCKELKSNI